MDVALSFTLSLDKNLDGCFLFGTYRGEIWILHLSSYLHHYHNTAERDGSHSQCVVSFMDFLIQVSTGCINDPCKLWKSNELFAKTTRYVYSNTTEIRCYNELCISIGLLALFTCALVSITVYGMWL